MNVLTCKVSLVDKTSSFIYYLWQSVSQIHYAFGHSHPKPIHDHGGIERGISDLTRRAHKRADSHAPPRPQ